MEPPRPRLKKKMGRSATIRSLQSSDPGQMMSVDLKCCGILHGNAVIVTGPNHITALVRNGCFGKGIFSRSIPSWNRVTFPDVGSQGRGSVEEKTENQSKRIKLDKEMEEGEEGAQSIMQTESTSLEFPSLASTLDATLVSTTEACSKEAGTFCSDPMESTVCARESLDTDFVQQATILVKELRDPPGVTEYLQLSSEEALYLAHEVGVLEVQGSLAVEKCYTPCELWNCFCECDEHFIEKYIAYRYYRHRGWVPKSGLKFGVDFLLYKHGPAFYHSSYAVVVRMVDKPNDLGHGELTWHSVISLCRVNDSAMKDLLICYIIKPPNLGKEELQSPSCVSRFLVEEMFVNRWVPDKERD